MATRSANPVLGRVVPDHNTSEIVLATGARTTTQTGSDIENLSARACHLVVSTTTIGTGSITPKIQGKDANGIYYDILVGAAITTDTTTVLKVGPSFTAAANAVANDALPATIRIVVTANNANSAIYSVGLNLIP